MAAESTVMRSVALGTSRAGEGSRSHPDRWAGRLSWFTEEQVRTLLWPVIHLRHQIHQESLSLDRRGETLTRLYREWPCDLNKWLNLSGPQFPHQAAGTIIHPAPSFGGVLVPQGCCNTMPQTGGLKTIDTYYLTVLEARPPKSRRQQSHTPPETCGWGSFQASSCVCQKPWHALGRGCSSAISASVTLQHSTLMCLCLSLSSVPIRTPAVLG